LNIDDVRQRQTKVISTKVSIAQYNRFNILAEYLYKIGLIQGHTPSALLRASIEHLLLEYQDKLDEYCENSTMNSSLPTPTPPLPTLSSHEPREHLESDNEENFTGELILEGIQSKYENNNDYHYDIDKEPEIQEQTEAIQMLPSVSDELEDKIDELAKNIMNHIDTFDKIYEIAKKEDFPIDEIIEDKERLREFLRI